MLSPGREMRKAGRQPMTKQGSTDRMSSTRHAKKAMLVGVAIIAMILSLSASGKEEPDSTQRRESRLQAIVDANPMVASALEDGALTVEEVEVAVARGVRCLEQQEVRVLEAEFASTGRLRVKYVGGTTHAAADRADEVFRACFAAHVDDFTEAFGIVNHPSEQELARYWGKVRDCLRSRGIMVEGPDDIQSVEDRIAVRECRHQAEQLIFG